MHRALTHSCSRARKSAPYNPASLKLSRQMQCYNRQSAIEDLIKLGLRQGQTALIHASMRAIGSMEGGASAVVDALRIVLGQEGTLVVPTGTPNNSDSSRAYLSNVAGMTTDQRRRYRKAMPAFDPKTTPSAGMGILAEIVRTTSGAIRSIHPQTSFAALGPRANEITGHHDPRCHLGEQSPLRRLYDLDAWILLLGVGYQCCSAFHLAEYRYAPRMPRRTYRCVVLRNNQPQWWQYSDAQLDDSDFYELGSDLDRTKIPLRGTVGRADCRLLPIRPTVDYAVGWLRHHRLGLAPACSHERGR
jgi:aminoglycoside 3-N-acetyltransferase